MATRFDVFGVCVVVIVLCGSDFEIETGARSQDHADVDVGVARLADARRAVQVRSLNSSSGRSSGLIRSILLSKAPCRRRRFALLASGELPGC